MDEEHVQVLALEYQTLRADLQTRSAARFQFLGFVTSAAAILATGLGHSTVGSGGWRKSAVSCTAPGR